MKMKQNSYFTSVILAKKTIIAIFYFCSLRLTAEKGQRIETSVFACKNWSFFWGYTRVNS